MTAHSLLNQLDPWLQGRCRYVAAQLPGLGADEVYQQVVEEFLRELDRWLQQDATVDVLAQARCLLAYCLRHVRTRAIRERRRFQPLPEVESGDPVEPLAEPAPPVDAAAARDILKQIRTVSTPPCGLCLLSLRLPAVVEVEDARRAKAWKKGGSRAVPRPLPEAWEIFGKGLERPRLVADEAAWKDHVGLAWYTEGPIDKVPAAARNAAAGKVERYANRGADDLRSALLADGGSR